MPDKKADLIRGTLGSMTDEDGWSIADFFFRRASHGCSLAPLLGRRPRFAYGYHRALVNHQ
jgi:hypothetical protein